MNNGLTSNGKTVKIILGNKIILLEKCDGYDVDYFYNWYINYSRRRSVFNCEYVEFMHEKETLITYVTRCKMFNYL